MFDSITKKIKWGDLEYTLETGVLARQATAAVVVSCGNTSVLSTVTVKDEPMPDIGYSPLSVHYQEKALAAGKIPGGFFKREGRPSEKEILTSRLIDRPLRALLGKKFLYETQIICNVLSYDKNHDADVIALLASMASVNLARLPVPYTVAACRVAKIDGELVLNPSIGDLKSSTANVVMAGSAHRIVMIEGDLHEFGETEMEQLLEFGLKSMGPMIDVLQEFRDMSKVDKNYDAAVDREVQNRIAELLESCGAQKKIMECQSKHNPGLCKSAMHDLKMQILQKKHEINLDVSDDAVVRGIYDMYDACAREMIVRTKKRLDGRAVDTVRDIDCRVNFLPTPHGSALFTRGKTQALCTVTLGTKDDEQIIDSLQEEYRESFMLHYNFPPFAVGEVNARLGSPSRREIGHGKLAWKAFYRLLPNGESFPYTVRVVSDILESNGSSSMATVCGASLAMWDAAIPLSKHVAGVAMGAVINEKESVILSDISGDEDGYGDMDFKIAGTRDGITAIQLDVKCDGIDLALTAQILKRAHENRLLILDHMQAAMEQPRLDLKENVLRVHVLKIEKEQIAELIGGGGKTVRGICSASQSKIDIDENGTVKIYASQQSDIDKAVSMIDDIFIRPEVGKIYSSQISKLLPFGAVLNIGKHEAWLHISEIADRGVSHMEEVLKPSQTLEVKVLSVDEKGKIRVTTKLQQDITRERPVDRGRKPAFEGKRPFRGRDRGRSAPFEKKYAEKKYANTGKKYSDRDHEDAGHRTGDGAFKHPRRHAPKGDHGGSGRFNREKRRGR